MMSIITHQQESFTAMTLGGEMPTPRHLTLVAVLPSNELVVVGGYERKQGKLTTLPAASLKLHKHTEYICTAHSLICILYHSIVPIYNRVLLFILLVIWRAGHVANHFRSDCCFSLVMHNYRKGYQRPSYC